MEDMEAAQTVQKRTRTPAQRARSARQKGNRVEREVLDYLRELGLQARLTQHSGATADKSEKGDLLFYIPGTAIEVRTEVKARADDTGFKKLLRWLGKNDMLVVRQDRKQPFYVLPQRTFENLINMLIESKDVIE